MKKRVSTISKKMVTRQEAAMMFGVAPGTLANWLSHSRGPRAYRVNRRKILYDVHDLELFFQANPVETVDSIGEQQMA
jgi:hypothetical protein